MDTARNTAKARMGGAVVLYMGNSRALADGQEVAADDLSLKTVPFVDHARTLVPLRFIGEKLGTAVDWNSLTHSVRIVFGETVITMSLNNPAMRVGDKAIILDVPAKIVNNRTFLPLRAISEVFGKFVLYDKNHRLYVAQLPDTETNAPTPIVIMDTNTNKVIGKITAPVRIEDFVVGERNVVYSVAESRYGFEKLSAFDLSGKLLSSVELNSTKDTLHYDSATEQVYIDRYMYRFVDGQVVDSKESIYDGTPWLSPDGRVFRASGDISYGDLTSSGTARLYRDVCFAPEQHMIYSNGYQIDDRTLQQVGQLGQGQDVEWSFYRDNHLY